MSPIRQSHELKALKGRLVEAEVELASAINRTKEAQRTETQARKKTEQLREQVERLETGARDVVVSEHAILRFLERIEGLDLDHIRSQILSPKTIELIETFGSGKYPMEGGGRVIVKDRTVVTIEPK